MDYLQSYWQFFLPLLTFIYMFLMWYIKGREKEILDPIFPREKPPLHNGKPLSPVEVGTLLFGTFDPKDISTALFGLAVKGYVKIIELPLDRLTQTKNEHAFIKIKNSDRDLSPFEINIMDDLFIDNQKQVTVSEMNVDMYHHIDKYKENAFRSLIDKGFYKHFPDKIKNRYRNIALFMAIMTFILNIFIHQGEPTYSTYIIFSLLTGLPFWIFANYMPVKTASGSTAYIKILGFRKYLMTAEKKRLVFRNDRNLFGRLLPYAMALDVVEKWSSVFTEIVQYPPEWYQRIDEKAEFSAKSFAETLLKLSETINNIIFSLPDDDILVNYVYVDSKTDDDLINQ